MAINWFSSGIATKARGHEGTKNHEDFGIYSFVIKTEMNDEKEKRIRKLINLPDGTPVSGILMDYFFGG